MFIRVTTSTAAKNINDYRAEICRKFGALENEVAGDLAPLFAIAATDDAAWEALLNESSRPLLGWQGMTGLAYLNHDGFAVEAAKIVPGSEAREVVLNWQTFKHHYTGRTLFVAADGSAEIGFYANTPMKW